MASDHSQRSLVMISFITLCLIAVCGNTPPVQTSKQAEFDGDRDELSTLCCPRCAANHCNDSVSNARPNVLRCWVYSSIDELRNRLGSNEYSLIQGLNSRQSRKLYHKLLPHCIVDSPKYKELSICHKLRVSLSLSLSV